MQRSIIRRIDRAVIATRAYFKRGHLVNEAGWAQGAAKKITRPSVIAELDAEWAQLVEHVAMLKIKSLGRYSRPTAAKVERTLAAQVAAGQFQLPGYAEFYRELYRPNGSGGLTAGPALRVGEAYVCAMAGIRMGRSTITKHERLLAMVKLAQQKQFADDDYLSKLWGHAKPIIPIAV